MGQCYDVRMKARFRDEDGAAKALHRKIQMAQVDHVNYSLDHYKEIGIGTEKLMDLMRIFFGGWDGAFVKRSETEYESDPGFNASYGWESLMMDAFTLMAPFMYDGSEIKIYPDSGCDHGKVYAGKVKWLS